MPCTRLPSARRGTSSRVTTIDLIGFPMDPGANRRGVDRGPSALRIAGLKAKLSALDVTVQDLGDIPVGIQDCQHLADARLKYMHEIVRTAELLRERVADCLEAGHLPLCLGVDPAVTAALGTPVAGGLTYREAHLGMETIAEHGGLKSMDVVEINPILDMRHQSARLASDLVASSFGQRIL